LLKTLEGNRTEISEVIWLFSKHIAEYKNKVMQQAHGMTTAKE
jgi:hypothetical protein